jgi:CheY-like chemotaxis protein
MNDLKLNLLLADDDDDDCIFFREALDELLLPVALATVNDGVALMNFLSNDKSSNLPDLIFLDLNMPRKSGIECLTEIKNSNELRNLPIIIFSTSFNAEIIDLVYEKGATHYIQKPAEFSKLKRVIENALATTAKNNFKQPVRKNFVLQP